MKKWWLLTLTAIVMIVMVACNDEPEKTITTSGSGDNPSGGETAEVVKVKVGYMPNFASLNTVITGIEIGSFEENGIEVELVEFSDGPTIIAAMESGSIDFGYIGPGAHVLPIQGKADIVAFSQLGNADEVIGNTEKGVSSLADLKGKKVAIATGTSSETILQLALQEAGLTKDDVTLFDMDASAIVTAMISGSVDAAATWSPNTNTIKAELGSKAVMLANNIRYAEQFPSIASWVTAPGYSEENKEVTINFIKGLYKAMDYRVDNLEEVAKWTAAQMAVDEATVQAQTGDGDWLTADEMLSMIDDNTMAKLYEQQQADFIKAGRITDADKVDVSKYVLFDLMKEAAK